MNDKGDSLINENLSQQEIQDQIYIKKKFIDAIIDKYVYFHCLSYSSVNNIMNSLQIIKVNLNDTPKVIIKEKDKDLNGIYYIYKGYINQINNNTIIEKYIEDSLIGLEEVLFSLANLKRKINLLIRILFDRF